MAVCLGRAERRFATAPLRSGSVRSALLQARGPVPAVPGTAHVQNGRSAPLRKWTALIEGNTARHRAAWPLGTGMHRLQPAASIHLHCNSNRSLQQSHCYFSLSQVRRYQDLHVPWVPQGNCRVRQAQNQCQGDPRTGPQLVCLR
jgi:hypothetical protein